MYRLAVENPVARKQDVKIPLAERPETLDGKVVGLYWNGKQGGDTALEQIAECIREEYPTATVRKFYLRYYPLKRFEFEKMARECDVVVGTTGD